MVPASSLNCGLSRRVSAALASDGFLCSWNCLCVRPALPAWFLCRLSRGNAVSHGFPAASHGAPVEHHSLAHGFLPSNDLKARAEPQLLEILRGRRYPRGHLPRERHEEQHIGGHSRVEGVLTEPAETVLHNDDAEEHASDDQIPGEIRGHRDSEDDSGQNRAQIPERRADASSSHEHAESLKDLRRGNSDNDVPDDAEAVCYGERRRCRRQGKGGAPHDTGGALEAVHMRSA